MKKKTWLWPVAVLALLAVLLCALPDRAEESAVYSSPEQLRGKSVGSLTGAPTGNYVTDFFDGDVTIEYYAQNADMALAVESGRVDAYICDNVTAARMCRLYDAQIILDPPVKVGEICFAFAKNDPAEAELCEQWNEFVLKLREDGTLDRLREKWTAEDEEGKTLDIPLTGNKGTLTWACSTNVGAPFCYLSNGEFIGYEVELVRMFCAEHELQLEITDYDIGGMISAVQAGKVMMGGTGTLSTPERRETMLFCECTYLNEFVLVTKGAAGAAAGSVLQRIAESFEKTFIRENRWMLFLEGIGRTLLISVFAIVLGTLLGFGGYLWYRTGSPVAKAISDALSWLIHGMPTVVLLMILFYIVFGRIALDGMWVAVLAFTLIFGAAFLAMMKSGVAAVDPGQLEAAYALAYTDREAFYRVIFPQALRHLLPIYKGEVVTLLKATSVVGYITVRDLTKASDLIRSNTYEAFFPLIATAIIYFLLAGALIKCVKLVDIRTDRRRRSNEQIVKGVQTHD